MCESDERRFKGLQWWCFIGRWQVAGTEAGYDMRTSPIIERESQQWQQWQQSLQARKRWVRWMEPSSFFPQATPDGQHGCTLDGDGDQFAGATRRLDW